MKYIVLGALALSISSFADEQSIKTIQDITSLPGQIEVDGRQWHEDGDGDMWTTPCSVKLHNYDPSQPLRNASITNEGSAISVQFNKESDYSEFSNNGTTQGKYESTFQTVLQGSGFGAFYQRLFLEIEEHRAEQLRLNVRVQKIQLGYVTGESECTISI